LTATATDLQRRLAYNPRMTTAPDTLTVRIGHSPDPDDAFMWYPLVNTPDQTGPDGQPLTPKVDTEQFEFVHLLEDIQSLNERSEKGELEVTALSIHQYPYIADKYALTSCGSSMGEKYGPKVVASRDMTLDDLKKTKIAIPGERTTAYLTLSLLLGKGAFEYEVVPFDQIIERVQDGDFEAGLIIHEGQLTYSDAGLTQIVDLGEWWFKQHELPLPLGGNAVRRDLGEQTMRELTRVLLRSIRWALEHRRESVKYALQFARGMETDLADRFVDMYVNKWTLDYGPTGQQAVNTLMREAAKADLIPDPGPIDFVQPAPG